MVLLIKGQETYQVQLPSWRSCLVVFWIQLFYIVSLCSASWGHHALIGDPRAGIVVFQWFDEIGKTAPVRVQEMGTDLSREEEPVEVDFGDPKWKLYRLALVATPKSKYKLRINDTDVFLKMPPSGLPIRIASGGDMLGHKGRFQRMCELVRNIDPDLIIMGGDLAYALSGAQQKKAFKCALSKWKTFFEISSNRLRDSTNAVIPWLVVVGNHDYRAKDDAGKLFLRFFSNPDGNAKQVIDFHGFSIFSLDTGHVEPIEGEQTVWLEQQLKDRKDVPWKIAVYHIGAYPAAHYQINASIPTTIRASWLPHFEQGGIIAAFENHSHCYKRTFPLTEGKVNPEGVTYFGDGCWGMRPRKYTNNPQYFAKIGSINHIYVLDVEKEHLHVKAINDEGTVFDEYSFYQKKPM